MQWLIQGGIFMIPLLLCSVMSLAVIVERWVFYWKTLARPLSEFNQPELVVKDLRQRLMILHTVITIAPMLGLLGTLFGLMKSFMALGNYVGVGEPKQISVGIAEALNTTAGGIIIAVFATIFYNYFTAKLDGYVADYQIQLEQEDQEHQR